MPRGQTDTFVADRAATRGQPDERPLNSDWAIKKRTTPIQAEDIWVAGVVSIQGSFTRVRKNAKSPWMPIFRIRSTSHHEVLRRLSRYANVSSRVGRDGRIEVTLYGEKLHYFMERVWPVLTTERRNDYLRLLQFLNND